MALNHKDKGTVVGGGTLWFPRLRKGIVNIDSSYEGYAVTPGMVARSYIEDLLEISGRKRVGWDKRSFGMLEKTPPQFVEPCVGEFVQWDIKSCFWSIYSKLALDFQYWGDHWGHGTVPYSQLPSWWGEDKAIRNSAIGCLRARTLGIWDGTQVMTRPFYNRLLSPMLWGFLCDFLNAIAAEAFRKGAVYYNVDGGCWPADRYDESGEWASWLVDMGLQPIAQYAGEGEIMSGGNWRIGNERKGIGTVKRASRRFYDCPRAVQVWKLNYHE